MHSFLSTIKHLGKIRLHMIFTVSVNSLKKFLNKPKILKFTTPSLRLVVLVKIVTSLYFLRIIDYGIK